MDHEQVFGKLHALAVLLVVRHKDVFDLLGQVEVAAVERVVKALGDLIKIIAAGDHVPAGRDFQLIHQGNQPVQDFGNASAHSGGVDHLYGLAAQMTGEDTDLIQLRLSDDGPVVFQARWG